ncbi:MAG: carbamoyltransferase C-terminal domain-containing protein [Candidatus Omnitrophota bacterium]|nr:carbamoyltransferase C-terminal domain-containing protein [Candidatus Omnitrophota bacterium]
MQRYYLGINSSHDASVCLFRKNTLISAIEEERLNKDKHSVCWKVSNIGRVIRTLPYSAISYVLQEAGIGLDEVDNIYVNDCDLLGTSSIKTVAEYLLPALLPVKDKSKIIFIPPSAHHLMHAYNAHYLSPFKESVILVVDAYASGDENKKRSFETIFYAKNNKIEEIYSRVSEKGEMGIGAFYQFFCKLLNFNARLNGGLSNNYFEMGHDEPGKLMALASYGRLYFAEKIVKKNRGLLSIRTRDLYEFALKYNLVKEVADPRLFDKLDMTASQRLLTPSKILTDYSDEFVQNLAYFAQRQLEDAMFILIDIADRIKKSNNLCISGGVALNCLANGKIKARYKNKSIYIPFAPADNGNAIGSCFYAYARNNKSTRKFIFHNTSPFLGRKYRVGFSEIIHNAQKAGLSIKKENLFVEKLSKKILAKKIAQFLYDDMIIAFITGGSEFGPRALGHRSILASPFDETTRDYLNLFVKNREWFRPFAPVVLSSHKDIYFETHGIKDSNMAFTVDLKKKFSYFSAIKNKDNTSRIQIVDSRDKGLLVGAIKEFGSITGGYLLLNTSCNIKGLPIIEHPMEIFYLYKKMPVDIIVIDDILIIPAYDIFQEFTRYKEGVLDITSKEKLAGRFFESGNYFRAKIMYRKIFEITNKLEHLLDVFKSLLFLPYSDELKRGFYELKRKRRFFLTGRFAKDVIEEYFIYMALYEICYGRGTADIAGLHRLISKKQNENKKRAALGKCKEGIFLLSKLAGEEKFFSQYQRNNKIRDLFYLLAKEDPAVLNNQFFQQLLRKS